MRDNLHRIRPRGWVDQSLSVLVVVLIAVSVACTSPAKFRPASDSANFPPYEGEVRVLENLPPSDQYTRIGVVIVEGVLLTKEASMVAAVKKEAAQKGANAVVMQSPVKVTKDPDGGTNKRLAAWAIRLNR